MYMFAFLPGHRRSYRAFNEVRISAARLEHNYRAVQELAGDKAVGVILKSNAYGHGLIPVARVAQTLGVPYVIVDSTYEALILKDHKIRVPVMVMGFTALENLQKKKYPFTFVASDRASLETLLATQPHAPIHIFINTGMNREGFDIAEVPWLIATIRAHPSRTFEGVMSHFADADREPESDLTRQQLASWNAVLAQFRDAGISFSLRHIDASNSTVHARQADGNLVRAGKAFYGIAGGEHKNYARFLPALEFVSTVVTLRRVKKGESVSYGATYVAPNDIHLAVIPAGYQEGVERRLSNAGVVTIRGVLCPIVGRVCMNYTCIDVSAVEGVAVGDEVTVYSNDQAAPNSLLNVSCLVGSIPHEIMTRVDHTVRRVVQ